MFFQRFSQIDLRVLASTWQVMHSYCCVPKAYCHTYVTHSNSTWEWAEPTACLYVAHVFQCVRACMRACTCFLSAPFCLCPVPHIHSLCFRRYSSTARLTFLNLYSADFPTNVAKHFFVLSSFLFNLHQMRLVPKYWYSCPK